jgi:hypothetical protein
LIRRKSNGFRWTAVRGLRTGTVQVPTSIVTRSAITPPCVSTTTVFPTGS